MPRRVALIEDEADLASNYRAALEREGYAVDVYTNRAEALRAFAQSLPDLAIIDIELGDEPKGGHRLCQALREQSKILPIVFLTARDDEADEIAGLTMGANDYLSKSLSLKIITTRIDGLFTMYDALMAVDEVPEHSIDLPPLHMDIDRKSVSWKGQPVELTYTSFLILECLVRHPGHVKSPQQLMDAAGKTIEPASVSSYMKRIRAAFRAVDADCDPIKSDYGIGYSWRGDG